MSVTVQHLNADSSFLLVFSPKKDPSIEDLQSANGAFTVLIDPWLVGSSIMNAKWFAITNRVTPSAIAHLSEIEEPDVVLVSQNKSDHCHKETLLQLRPEGKSLIVAEPGAAKAVKSWNHFDPNRVHSLAKYDPKTRFGNTLRLRIPPLSSNGLPGELNIAFIPAKNYMTGLHNAFGITYQAPTSSQSFAPFTTIDLPRSPFTPSISNFTANPGLGLPASPPESPRQPFIVIPNQDLPTQPSTTFATGRTPTAQQIVRPCVSQWQNPEMYESIASVQDSEFTPLEGPIPSTTSPETDTEDGDLIEGQKSSESLLTPPSSPETSSCSNSRGPSVSSLKSPAQPSSETDTTFTFSLPNSPSLADIQARYSRPPTVRPGRAKAISVIYSPHGITLSDLKPYIQTHLVSTPGALPLTCLFHSFDYASNPWWFGGNIMKGMGGGIQIAKALMARYWISAHDEVKDDKGVAVKLLQCERNSAEMVKQKIAESGQDWNCRVHSLGVGEYVKLDPHDSIGRDRPG